MMWNYCVKKAPLNLPKLSVKTQNQQKIEELLKPIGKLPILLSDDEDLMSDCSSGIVDVFEQYHKNSFLKPLEGTKSKYLTKQEADWKTVEQFTEDYKRTVQQLRKELQLADAMMSEDDKTIELQLASEEKHIFLVTNDLETVANDPIKVDPEAAQSETETSNSAVWNMIKAYKKEYFATSPPQYDIYDVTREHYLKRPHVSWLTIEDSRRKCEKWLDECDIK